MYVFRREDNGELVEVDFAAMMEMDALGVITLPDGVQARRVRDGEPRKSSEPSLGIDKPIVSDTLGFAQHQLEHFEADRKAHGFTGVEFVRDPHVPEFFQVKFSSVREWRRYIHHRGMCDKNSRNGGGVVLTQGDLDRARELINRQFLPEGD